MPFILKEGWNLLWKDSVSLILPGYDNGTGSMAATLNAYVAV